LRVIEQFAGKTVRCPRCGTPAVAPARSAAPAAAEEAPFARPVGGFAGSRAVPRADEGEGELYAPCGGCGVLIAVAIADPGPAATCDACRAAAAAAIVRPPRLEESPASPAPTSSSAAGAACPQCGAAMSAVAVVCLDCGFNKKTGKHLKTVSQRAYFRWYSSDLSPAAPSRFWWRSIGYSVSFCKRRGGPKARSAFLAGYAVGKLGLGGMGFCLITSSAA
jgi:hypothetical protein